MIAIFSITSFAIVGLHRSSGRAYSADPIPTFLVTDNSTDAVTAYSTTSNGDVLPLAPSPTGLLEPQFVAVDTSGKIYITNGQKVSIFAKGSNGDAAPVAIIAGTNTGLSQPAGVAVDALGRIYVADTGAESVFVYPALGSSTGLLNEAPSATISGGNTGLSLPEGIAVDLTDHRIYVADQGDGGCDTTANVFVYETGTSGDVTPVATIEGSDLDGNTTLCFPFGIAFDSSRNIYVADSAIGVDVYKAGSTGAIDPTATISSDALTSPSGVGLDSNANIYVANCPECSGSSGADGVFVFSAGSNGTVAPFATISGGNTELSSPTDLALDSGNNIYVADESSNSATTYSALGSSTGLLNEAPISDISTTVTTGLSFPEGIALDSIGNIYVSDDGPSGGGPGSVFLYSAGSNGNAAPSATIGGDSTGLTSPAGIAVDPSRNIYVADPGATSVFVYTAGSNGDVAPAPPSAVVARD